MSRSMTPDSNWEEWLTMDEPRTHAEQTERRHETRDVDTRRLANFGVGLAMLIVAGLVASFAAFRYFVVHQSLGPPASPFENVRTLPPAPRLQVEPRQDLKHYLTGEDETLNSYGWVDRKAGIVRIPITRAMELLLQQGLPVRSQTADPPSVTQSADRRNTGGPDERAARAAGPARNPGPSEK